MLLIASYELIYSTVIIVSISSCLDLTLSKNTTIKKPLYIRQQFLNAT